MSSSPTPPSGPDAHGDAVAWSEAAPASLRSSLVGQLVDGRYYVDRVLGEGGMGVVYEARHKAIGRRVALKVLRSEYANDREILERFMLEARSASAIGNPHIVDIFDFGILGDGSTYFAMEFLEGRSLTKVIEERPKPEEIGRIAIQICEGLGAAHERGIVHRDLKPDNLHLIPRANGDFVKILDFGIAKVSSTSTAPKLTKMGAVFGTPHYMSPEQAAGTAVDARADIYALGVILYELGSGKLPFDSDNFMGILTQHMYKAPTPIRALPGLERFPAGLEAIVQKCLEKQADRRYSTMAELAADLRRFLDGQKPLAVDELLGRASAMATPGDLLGTGGPDTPGSGSKAPLVILALAAVAAIALGLGLAARRASNVATSAPSAASTAAEMASATSASGTPSAPSGAGTSVAASAPTSSARGDSAPTPAASVSAAAASPVSAAPANTTKPAAATAKPTSAPTTPKKPSTDGGLIELYPTGKGR
jgi:serine/threonine-protein kinase